MRLRRPNVKAALPALSVIFVVAAAAVVWHNLPTPTDLYGPFDVHAEAGSPAVGRAVTATVTDRFFVETLKAEISPGIAQRGSWVFDVAPALLELGASESLTLRVWVGDAFLDSRLVIRIPTDDSRVSRSDTVDLVPPVQSAS